MGVKTLFRCAAIAAHRLFVSGNIQWGYFAGQLAPEPARAVFTGFFRSLPETLIG